MGNKTAIEWTDHTFNPWWGCAKVSPGCDHCYAEAWAKRTGTAPWGVDTPRREFGDEHWNAPRLWNRQAIRSEKRTRVFCASMADVFDKNAPEGARERLWQLIRSTPNLDWQLLTKRIGNAPNMLPVDWGDGWANVWLGITVVNQEEADRDIPKLLAIPACTRFLSCEPLLGSIDLSRWIEPTLHCGACGAEYGLDEMLPDADGHRHGADKCAKCGASNCMGSTWGDDALQEKAEGKDLEVAEAGGEWDHGYRLHWVISGGESGPKARPSHPDWHRSLREQCAAAGVAYLFKQWGEWLPGSQYTDELALSDPNEFSKFRLACWDGEQWDYDTDPFETGGMEELYRVGKKAAGRTLDGKTHDERPA